MICTNTFDNLDKYSLKFGKIQLEGCNVFLTCFCTPGSNAALNAAVGVLHIYRDVLPFSTVASSFSGSGAAVCTTFHTPPRSQSQYKAMQWEKRLNKCICAGDKANSCWKLSPLFWHKSELFTHSWKSLRINNYTAPNSILTSALLYTV